MAFLKSSRAKLVWALELALGLELYACAVLALHARGLRATPVLASAGLVVPALVIPPVFYLLVGLVSVRPLSIWRVLIAAGAMCGVHAMLVMATGALFVIPDLVDYGAAVAFSLWGSPAVTMLQLTAAPLVLARLRPLIMQPRPGARGASARRAEAKASAAPAREPIAPAATMRESSSAAPRPAPVTPRATATGALPLTVTTPAVTSSRPAPVVSEPIAAAAAPRVAPLVVSSQATPSAISAPVVRVAATPGPAGQPARRVLVDPVEPMVRVAFSRLADQLPVEMFARGEKGRIDMLRPGVSLFVPRALLLPHLAEGAAPVKWKVVADQFPRDELVLTDTEIEERLPHGSLRLPLDEVLPQIPADLLVPSKQAVTVAPAEELPPPVKPGVEAHQVQEFHVQSLAALVAEPPKPEAAESDRTDIDRTDIDRTDSDRTDIEAAAPEEAELVTEERSDVEAAENDFAEIEGDDVAEADVEAAELAPEALAPAMPRPAELEAPTPSVIVAQSPKLPAEPEPRRSRETNGIAASHERTAEARRIAALLAPVMNGLELGERDGAGMPLVTAIAPILSDDAVVATAIRIVPWLSDSRLPEPVNQATLATSEATIVLTPFGGTHGDALLVAAVASRGALARLERLSRSVAGESPSLARHEAHAAEDSDPARELLPTTVPPSIRDLASSLTSVGPVAPAVLRDKAGVFRVCLFRPGALEPAPLAHLARDLFEALEESKVGSVTSVTLRLETCRLVVRALGLPAGQTTLLVVVGPMTRPGLARLELERAAKVIGG
jgi:hypothetical protein